ncbi:hypothetical protein FJT64_018071 [Amphibalanus amphitrite]|uniref:Uncharacterized protein n=1 Tax=Amphibalanus amphitrite TaxID=1232801 RepID=A0A6A4X9G1_AMPAM|nr:hypothetical protein FJT64_018071 [Amphibalanus amphitrite]
MAGADVIFDRESNKWRRISWSVLLIVCITLLAAQFPAVTICNKNWFNLTRARSLLADVFPGNNCSDEDILRDDINAGSGCT